MNQKKIDSTAFPAHIDVELPAVELAKDMNCEKCSSRFKCWTHRGMALQVEKFSLSSDGRSSDRLKFTVYVPKCFRCSNLVGTEAHIHIMIAEQEQYINSLIMEQKLSADKADAPMELEIESVRGLF
jgi:hypothetical protein